VRNNRADFNFETWFEQFYAEQMAGYILQEAKPLFRAFAEAVWDVSVKEIGVDSLTQAEFERFVEEYTDIYVGRHIKSSKGQIRSLQAAIDDIEQRMDEWIEKRPEKISTNETTRLSNAIAVAVYFAAGLSVVWQIRGPKTCPYCKSLAGKRISRGEAFVDDGDLIKVEQDGKWQTMKINGLKQNPPLHQGCDCYTGPI